MPPHCDTREGRVVKAAMKALETGNLNHVLLRITKESEKGMKTVFGWAGDPHHLYKYVKGTGHGGHHENGFGCGRTQSP